MTALRRPNRKLKPSEVDDLVAHYQAGWGVLRILDRASRLYVAADLHTDDGAAFAAQLGDIRRNQQPAPDDTSLAVQQEDSGRTGTWRSRQPAQLRSGSVRS